jgi:hypothetical protein
MLFGGTLGMSQAASAGLVFNLNGPSTSTATSGTANSAYTFLSSETYAFEQESNTSFAATTFTLTTGLSASWSATSDSTGFNVNVSALATQGEYSFVQTTRSFTVTGSQQITMTWSGSFAILLGQYNGGQLNNSDNWRQPIAAWSSGNPFGSTDASASGTLTTTLLAGTYYLSSTLNNVQPASFSFAVVPAPGAFALLGVAGIIGARRRRA